MAKQKKKNKLSALIMLLFLTVVVLVTSTYAWFTANKTVTVNNIQVNVATSSGIQISTDAVNWKTIIENSDIATGYTGHSNQIPSNDQNANAQLTAVSTAGDLVGGKLQMFRGTDEANAITGAFELTAEQSVETAGVTGDFVAFDFFLKYDANDTTAKTLYFTNDTNVSDPDGSGLGNASRVAFIVEGHQTSDVAASQALTLTSNDTANLYIWEPYPLTHTQKGLDNANSYYMDYLTSKSVTEPLALTMASKLPYDGVKAAIETPILIKDTYADANGGANAAYFNTVDTVTTNADRTWWFTIQPGITKIRAYFWVEGQDVDCENNASGHNITLKFGFTLDDPLA